jgi:hypothetical protein
MDVVDSIEESLLNLDSTFEKEGLVPMDAYRLKALLENLTKNQVVLTLENLASGLGVYSVFVCLSFCLCLSDLRKDQTALCEMILKVHYVKEVANLITFPSPDSLRQLLDASSESLSSDLIQTMNALQHISTNSMKYLTPGQGTHSRHESVASLISDRGCSISSLYFPVIPNKSTP